MIIKVNGKDSSIDDGARLDTLIKERGVSGKKVVIELNLDIIPRERWSDVTLKDGDTVEIINFVGGG